jgi:hypothetical protein
LVASTFRLVKPSWAHKAKNRRIQGCLMQLEYVLASFSCGAARGSHRNNSSLCECRPLLWRNSSVGEGRWHLWEHERVHHTFSVWSLSQAA